jgi:hypothetical protein
MAARTVFVVYETVAVKTAWGNLNEVAARHLGDSDTRTPILVKRDARSSDILLCIPSGDWTSPFEWIILDATPGGLVIENPVDGHFTLACSYGSHLNTPRKVTNVGFRSYSSMQRIITGNIWRRIRMDVAEVSRSGV